MMQESETTVEGEDKETDNTAAVSQGKTNCQDQRPDGQSMCPDSRHNTGTWEQEVRVQSGR